MAYLLPLLPLILLSCLPPLSASSPPSAVEEQPKVAAAIPALALSKAQLRLQYQENVARLNKRQKKWTAKLHPHFAEMPREEMRRWLGLRRDHAQFQKAPQGLPNSAKLGKKPTARREKRQRAEPNPVEEEFDARKVWPKCADVIGQIQDQSGCGSCWAVASASVMQDRICIASKGEVKMNVSSEDILSCEMKSFGCEGGYPENAFTFWYTRGVCTGGEYGSKEGCKPYPFPPHAKELYNTPKCKHRCENRYYKPMYKKDKQYGLKPVHLEDDVTEEQIMKAVAQGGPVEADMVVYYDFFHYSSGVYEHDEDSELAGGHAVRIIGWGFDNQTMTDYWLVANSWNSDWGMNGTFKIARGQDECQIETWGINYAEANMEGTPPAQSGMNTSALM